VNHLLSEAEEPIRHALERLVAKDIELRAFVVVDKVGNHDVFVQFARLVKNGALVFDVPLLRIVLETTTPEAAARAVETLSASLGVAPDERVLIREENGEQPPWRGLPFWKELFA